MSTLTGPRDLLDGVATAPRDRTAGVHGDLENGTQLPLRPNNYRKD